MREKGFKNFVPRWEDVAEFEHRPDLCRRSYRVVVLRKRVSVERGQEKLFEEYAYFFYLTNDRASGPEQVVFTANDRCDQENLIAQLKGGGVAALRNPLGSLLSNWAYMVMAALAWTLKAWWGLMLPAPPGRWHGRQAQEGREVVRMEFKRFVANLIRLPCQVVRSGRRLVYRLLSYNPWQPALLRGAAAWRTRTQC